MRKKFLFICLSWLIALTANAVNLNLYLTTDGLVADPNDDTPYATTDKSIEEGTVVTITYAGDNMKTVLSIYINGKVVFSGKLRQSPSYTFTAKKNCILRVEGAYAFDFSTNPNVYFTQDVDVTVTANEGATGEYWATYYNSTESYTADANTTVFQAALSGSSLTLTAVPNREIPATKAVILKSSSATITLTPASTTETLEGNSLTGTMTNITNPGNAYVLNYKAATGAGFYKLSASGNIGANKAYLVSGAGAPEFFSFDGNTTSINEVRGKMEDVSGEYYDLQGRRVSQPTKGLYIVNGKKVFINK